MKDINITDIHSKIKEYESIVMPLLKKGREFTIVTPYSCVHLFHTDKVMYKTYWINSKRELVSSCKALTTSLSYVLDLQPYDMSDSDVALFGSNFFDAPFEQVEIFNALRLVQIQAFKFFNGRPPHIDVFTSNLNIINFVPSADYSEITFGSGDLEAKTLNVDIKIIKQRRDFNHIDELRKTEYTASFVFEYEKDNVSKFYDAMMEIYAEFTYKRARV